MVFIQEQNDQGIEVAERAHLHDSDEEEEAGKGGGEGGGVAVAARAAAALYTGSDGMSVESAPTLTYLSVPRVRPNQACNDVHEVGTYVRT